MKVAFKLINRRETIVVSYVLINTIPEHEHKVYNLLSNQSKIVEIKPLFREYDMLAKVEISNRKKIGDYISNKIRPIEGIVDTKTIQ